MKKSDSKGITSGYTENLDKEMNLLNPMPIKEGFGDIHECYVSASGHTRLFSATRYGKRYMLKCLKPDFFYTPVYRQALTKEFEIGLQLEHPYICRTISLEQLHDLGATIVMEHIDGDTLQTMIEQDKLTAPLAHKITSQLMEALEYMHNKQIIHRDLKPSNIMITHNGQNVKLIDFGLSDSDTFCVLKIPAGTSGYIAPEQLMPNAKSEPAADIYSLGKVIMDMAQATNDKQLRKMAEICMRRDINRRPKNIQEAKMLFSGASHSHIAIIILGALVLFLAAIIALTYYNKRNMDSQKTESPYISTDSDTINQGNRVLDYQAWPKH